MDIPKYNAIHHGDCGLILKDMASESVDLVITSPPYAEQRKDSYGGISEEDYPDWILNIAKEVMRVLKPSGSFVLNIKEHAKNGVRSTYVLETILKLSKEFNLVDEFIWNKTNPFPTGSKKRLKDGFERCYHFTKTKEYKFYPNNVLVKSESKWIESEKKRKNKGAFNTTNGSNMNMSKRVSSGEMVRPSNVITLASSCENIGHPAVFPVGLPEFFIKLMTDENDVVLDCFGGSGTTALASIKTNRRYILIEQNHDYWQLANERIAKS